MNDSVGRIVIVGLLAVIVGVPLALKPGEDESARPQAVDAKTQAAAEKLVVITPHNEQIRFEVAQGFNRHRAKIGKPAVVFDFRSSGGTSDLIKQVVAEFDAQGRNALREKREVAGVGYDLFFGGGDIDHNRLADDISITDDEDKTRTLKFSPSVPLEISDEELKAIFPDAEISGARLYHPSRKWVGVVLASFGIVYNTDRLAALELPTPTTWTDLIDLKYHGEIALADPAHSGSIGAAYNAVLMRLGWHEGWAVLRRVFANGRYFASTSTKVSVDVSAGQAAAGMSIDFYGRFQASAVVGKRGDGAHRLGYVDPPGMTKQNADPVSILRGAPSPELARDFVLWLLSKEGQRLWNRKLGTDDGPVKFELRRQPIRQDMYTPEEMKHWTDDIHPFRDQKAFPPAIPDFYRTVATVAHAMAIDVHDDLSAAWLAIHSCSDETKRRELIAMFDTMPAGLTVDGLPADWWAIANDAKHPQHKMVADRLKKFTSEMTGRWRNADDPDAQLRDKLRWTAFFRANYREIVRKAGR